MTEERKTGLLEGMLDDLDNLVAKVDRIEAKVDAALNRDPGVTISAVTSAPGPVQAPADWPQGGLGMPSAENTASVAPMAQAPAPAPQPNYAAPPTTQAPIAAVPTLEQLTEKMLTLNEAQGEVPCLDLLRAHGGQDAEGSVSLRLVPQTNYVALAQAIDQQLGGIH